MMRPKDRDIAFERLYHYQMKGSPSWRLRDRGPPSKYEGGVLRRIMPSIPVGLWKRPTSLQDSHIREAGMRNYPVYSLSYNARLYRTDHLRGIIGPGRCVVSKKNYPFIIMYSHCGCTIDFERYQPTGAQKLPVCSNGGMNHEQRVPKEMLSF